MTTIAYKDGVLASDSRMTIDNTIVSDSKEKIQKLKDGSYAVSTGCVVEGDTFIKLLDENNSNLPELKDATIIHFKNGKLMVYHSRVGGYTVLPKGCYAWGSGAPFALAAMHSGKTAVDAIKVAIKLDVYLAAE